MLVLLALPIIVAVAAMRRYLHYYAPTNMLVRRVRVQSPRWRTAAVLSVLAAVLLVAMHTLSDAVASGAPGWINLVVLILAWDAIKLAGMSVQVTLRVLGRRIHASSPFDEARRRVLS